MHPDCLRMSDHTYTQKHASVEEVGGGARQARMTHTYACAFLYLHTCVLPVGVNLPLA